MHRIALRRLHDNSVSTNTPHPNNSFKAKPYDRDKYSKKKVPHFHETPYYYMRKKTTPGRYTHKALIDTSKGILYPPPR